MTWCVFTCQIFHINYRSSHRRLLFCFWPSFMTEQSFIKPDVGFQLHQLTCSTNSEQSFEIGISQPFMLAPEVALSDFGCWPPALKPPRPPEGRCDQMFLQQGFFSVFSARELFRDTALMEPRTTSLLLTFLWISEIRIFDHFIGCWSLLRLCWGI